MKQNARMWKAVGFSLSVHALLLRPAPLRNELSQVDVIRGVSSVELELLPVAAPEDGEAPSPRKVARPQPPRVDEGAYRRTPPMAFRNPPPRYPWQARLKGWEGTVLVRAWVSQEGKVVSVHIQRSSGYPTLDEAALQSIRAWKFRPAQRGGRRLAAVVEVPVTFRLDDVRPSGGK